MIVTNDFKKDALEEAIEQEVLHRSHVPQGGEERRRKPENL
jgi:hypothetical protein